MSNFSFNPCQARNSSSFAMSGQNIADDWKGLAQQLFFESNATTAVDVFCHAWIGSNPAEMNSPLPNNNSVPIWNHAMAKTIGWTIVMVLKTVFLERKFDSWSGLHYRFLNLGSTLVPFAMAMYGIYEAIGEAGQEEGEANKISSTSDTPMTTILWEHLVATYAVPSVQRWILTALASIVFHRLVTKKILSSKVFAVFTWIPGILAGMLSLACWIDEKRVATLLLGEFEDADTLFFSATLLRWTSNLLAGWFVYAGILTGVFGTTRFTSFPCFLLALLAGGFATMERPF